MILQVSVLGNPAPQGSKTPWGTEANPRTRPWRDTVAYDARTLMGSQEPMLGPLNLNVVFRLPRPKAHYRTGAHAGELKPDAPVWCPKKPDLDKLVRAVCDALTTAAVWHDDSQVATVHARKVYVSVGTQPGVDIIVQPLEGA